MDDPVVRVAYHLKFESSSSRQFHIAEHESVDAVCYFLFGGEDNTVLAWLWRTYGLKSLSATSLILRCNLSSAHRGTRERPPSS